MLSFWARNLLLAYMLARTLHFGAMSVFIAISVAYSAHAIAATLVFRQDKWRSARTSS